MYSKGLILASAIRQVRGLGDNKFEVVTSLRTFVFRAEKEGTSFSAVTYLLLLLVSLPLSLWPSDSLSGFVFLPLALFLSFPTSPLSPSPSVILFSKCLCGNLLFFLLFASNALLLPQKPFWGFCLLLLLSVIREVLNDSESHHRAKKWYCAFCHSKCVDKKDQ